jgi:hypothetical protein
VFFEQIITLWNIGSSRAEVNEPEEAGLAIPPNISQQPGVFFQGMLRTVTAGDYCSRVEHDAEKRITVKYERRHLALEARIQFALMVAEAFYGQKLFEKARFLLRPMFDKLLEVLESNSGSKGSMLQLLNYLQERWLQKGLDSGVIPANLFQTAKGFLMQGLDNLEDFSLFVDFEVAFKGAVTEQEEQYVISKFKDFYPEEVDYSLGDYSEEPDPDSIRQAAEELSRIASWLDVDADEAIDSLTDHADELEEERNRRESQDFDSPADGYSSPVASTAQGDIDSMFDALLE